MENKISFIKVNTLHDLLYHLKNTSNLKVYGGATSLHKKNKEITVAINENAIFATECKECCFIDKKERYIDFGAGITLNKILYLGKNKLPEYFYKAISSVANPLIRNTATLVGNICNDNFYNTLYAPLLAVDAKLEIRNYSETKVVELSKFTGLKNGEMITKLRLPLIDWDVEMFERLGPTNKLIDVSASYTFLAKSEKNTLTELRIAFCGKIKLRSNELENQLIGIKLPISKKAISNMIEVASEIYDKELSYLEEEQQELVHPMLKSQFLNLLRKSLEKLT